MATIRVRENGRVEVQVRRVGSKNLTKTFSCKKDAKAWARKIETELERGLFQDTSSAKSITLSDVIGSYLQDVLPSKKGQEPDRYRLGNIKKSLGCYCLLRIDSKVLNAYKTERLCVVSADSVRKELGLVSRLFNHAIKNLGVVLPDGNPVRRIYLPSPGKHRTRRLAGSGNDGELGLILNNIECQETRCFIELLVETAMRRSELASLTWSDVNLHDSYVTIADSKNGHGRMVPLSERAKELFGLLRGDAKGALDKVFLKKTTSYSQSFRRACTRLGIADLHLHDLRREAVSNFIEMGLNQFEVMAISGHKTTTMLQVYTRLHVTDLVKKIGECVAGK